MMNSSPPWDLEKPDTLLLLQGSMHVYKTYHLLAEQILHLMHLFFPSFF